MKKRAQVTIFIIIGIVLLTIIFIAIYITQGTIRIRPSESIETQADQLRESINRCLSEHGSLGLEILGKQGGYFNPANYRLYKNEKLTYLCEDIPNEAVCLNRMLTKSSLEKNIEDFLLQELQQCIYLGYLEDVGLDVETGEMGVNVDIGSEIVNINLDYPITISKGTTYLNLDKFTHNINVPLGKIHDAVADIVNSEASVGDFDVLVYSVLNRGFIIEKHRPYPDKIYIVKTTNNPYFFQFAIQDEEIEIKLEGGTT